eukprot:gene13416-biopygen17026
MEPGRPATKCAVIGLYRRKPRMAARSAVSPQLCPNVNGITTRPRPPQGGREHAPCLAVCGAGYK